MISIRKANSDDIPYLVNSYEEFANAMPFESSPNIMHSMFERMIYNHAVNFRVAISNDDAICGYMISTVAPLFVPWTMDAVAVENLFYVFPAYRNTRTAWLLMQDFIAWAKQNDCSLIIVSSRTALDGDKVGKFYERFGFAQMDANYFKVI